METQNTDMIEYLLPRYCSGEATVKECRQVEEWIRLSDENYRIAKQIHTLYLATDTMQVLLKVDTEKALSSVCQKMSKDSVRPQVSMLTLLQRVAAILFIPLLIAFGIQTLRPRPGMTTTIQLPDGSIVHLNSESKLTYPSFLIRTREGLHCKERPFLKCRKIRSMVLKSLLPMKQK